MNDDGPPSATTDLGCAAGYAASEDGEVRNMRFLLAQNRVLSAVICGVVAVGTLAYTGLMFFIAAFYGDLGSRGGDCVASVMKFPVIVGALAVASFLVATQRRWWVIALLLALAAAAVAWAPLGIKGLIGY
jgi:hypothetical protein